MNAQNDLFESHPDWLAHTLANAGDDLPEIKTRLPDGTQISRKANGVLWLTPPTDRDNPNGEALIISAGIHGNETAPIEVLNKLVSELLAEVWQLACPLLLMLGNPPAMKAGTRFMDVNMNRLFNGAHGKADYAALPEARRARFLEEMCRQFAMVHQPLTLGHYDLHTAIRPSKRERFALYPYVEGRSVPPEQCAFLLEAEVETLLLQHKESTVFSSFTAGLLKAESFTVELGKVEPFGRNDFRRFRGIERALRRRFGGQPAPAVEPPFDHLTVFEVVHEILNTGPSFRFHVPDEVANFTEYQPGTVIWEDDQSCYRVGTAPEAIVFPNREVPVGQRVGLMVRPGRSRVR
ncbi:succinylglutamate desuccinylase [Marinobacter halophilus]|uniref:Succinylglutamate desuccinylase n=1 Tax=Marinobacter halophilus TaxID=1323740 RepID=A0A2T1KG75_9GAMM|nr:succinylglutamate desuccinylase [Marinobacter halophilus]PSF08552.1 succinylglutamate desuccinylase [Marinobacter halophilus]GGC61636.1 succinylglutamate desuccinylase [Marinobacter halophilus]